MFRYFEKFLWRNWNFSKIDVQKCNKNAWEGHFWKILSNIWCFYIQKHGVFWFSKWCFFSVFWGSPLVFSALNFLATLQLSPWHSKAAGGVASWIKFLSQPGLPYEFSYSWIRNIHKFFLSKCRFCFLIHFT